MSNQSTNLKSLHDSGMQVRREVLGNDYVNRATTHTDALTTEFQEFIATYCWGEIWTDKRLGRRERSLIVLAITAALGKTAEFEAHAHGALRNGITRDELASFVRQIAVYCGVPAGVTAHKIIRSVLLQEDGGSHTAASAEPGNTGAD